jgi:GT2 family glycosyltransferase
MPTAARKLTISLVLYNSDLGLLERSLTCLGLSVARVLESGMLDSARLDVVDNATPGDYADRARALVEQVARGWAGFTANFQVAPANRGYGAGHNRLMLAADSDLHLVLNPDVELAEDALEQAVAYLHGAPGVVLLAPAVRGSGGDVEYLCKDYPSVLVLLVRASGLVWLRRFCRERLERYELRALVLTGEPADVPLVSGCCMLMRTSALQAEGGFNEHFFLYFEDFDLSLRLARRGRVQFYPGMRIVHHGGYAARKGWHHVRLFAQGGLRFFRLHGWRWL